MSNRHPLTDDLYAATLPGANPWTILESVRAAQTLLDDLQADAVYALRSQGETWAAVAAALGTTRQAAQQRYGS